MKRDVEEDCTTCLEDACLYILLHGHVCTRKCNLKDILSQFTVKVILFFTNKIGCIENISCDSIAMTWAQ